MATSTYRTRFSGGAVSSYLERDDQGNTPQVQIRGPEVILGDGAQATGAEGIAIGARATSSAAGAVAIGPDVVAASANTVAIGSGSSTPFQIIGAKGTVTQPTNNDQPVTLNATQGVITMAAAVNAGAGHTFSLNNTFVEVGSVVLLTITAETATASATRDAMTVCMTKNPGVSNAIIHVFNPDANATSIAPTIHFLVM